MTQLIVVVGAGGFGRETLDVIDAVNRTLTNPAFTVVGVVDDAPSEYSLDRLAERGTRWLGGIDEWLSSESDAHYLIAVGNPAFRLSIDGRLSAKRNSAAAVVHPSATVGSAGSIGAGSIICSGVQISTNVHLGRHVHVNPNATVGHDAVLGDYVSINPGGIVSGAVTVQQGVLLGAGSVVLQELTIGHDSIIGAAACVVKDVLPHKTVKGVPAL